MLLGIKGWELQELIGFLSTMVTKTQVIRFPKKSKVQNSILDSDPDLDTLYLKKGKKVMFLLKRVTLLRLY